MTARTMCSFISCVYSSSAPVVSALQPPKPAWSPARVPRVSGSSRYLPTIALGDLVLTTSDAVTSPGGGEVTWTVDTGVTDHGDVIFVQASEQSDKG